MRAARGAAGHDAVLLAAGGSRRLGQPKQLLTRDGEPLVRRAARLALATAPRRMLVVTGGAGDAVAAALHGLACERVDHAGWASGLAGSLHAAGDALAADASPSVLVLGCDQPALEASHLRALLDGAATSASGCAATHHGAAAVGIPAVVPAGWLRRTVQAARVDGAAGAVGDADRGDADRGFGRQLRALPPATLWTLDAPGLDCDIDTPDDLRAAIARGWLDAASPPHH